VRTLDVISLEEAVTLIRKRVPQVEEDTAAAVTEELGRLLPAVEQT
jgi:hypothetical protein